MGAHTGGNPAQDVAGHDDMGIGSADSFGAFGGNAAGAHVAVFAADTAQSESAMGLLGIEAIKGGFNASLLHVQEHLPHGRIGRSFNNILFTGEFFFSLHALPLFWDHAKHVQ
jgi:hypothetical protein